MGTNQPVSTYVTYLPAVLQRPFMQQFLLGFEAILTGGVAAPAIGSTSPPAQGIEQIIAGISTYFDPQATPSEFLPWLAQWAATSLRADWDETTQRNFLSQVVPLYQQRGTAAGLAAVLSLSLATAASGSSDNVSIQELTFSTSGEEMPAHYFEVTVTVSTSDPTLLARKAREVRAIIDREKPAHTFYGLKIQYPAMQIHDDYVGDTSHSPPLNPGFGRGILLGTWKDGTGATQIGTSVIGTTTSSG